MATLVEQCVALRTFEPVQIPSQGVAWQRRALTAGCFAAYRLPSAARDNPLVAALKEDS